MSETLDAYGAAPVTWQVVALRLGEALATDGPDGYYAMTPEQWLAWALAQIAKDDPHG